MRIVTIWMVLALLAGCWKEPEPTNNQAAARTPAAAPATPAKGPAITDLVGLYEGSGSPAHQMCVVKRAQGLGFGLVVWGGNNHSCSGSGEISRNGDRVELVMAGDSPCTLSGSISGTTITLSAEQPAGCSYYCGARARLAGAAVTRKGAGRDEAMKAEDLVGEPLCSGM